MPAALRRFVPPPRPLDDLGGPPPISLNGGIPYAGGVDFPDEGPPPLDPQAVAQVLQGGHPVPLEQRQDMAIDSPTSDWMFEDYRPTESEMQVRPEMQGRPGKPGGGLRRTLATILPIAQDLVAGAAAGSQAPTFAQGLGAGLSQHERQQQQREDRALKTYFAQQKVENDRQKLQLEASKVGAESEWRRAQAGEARERTKVIGPEAQSKQELQAAQAAAAKDLGLYNQARAAHQRALVKAGVPEAEAAEKAARAANFTVRTKLVQEEIDSGKTRREAELLADQRLRAVAQTAKFNAEAAALTDPNSPQNRTRQMFADAAVQNAAASLRRATLMAQQGQLKPADLIRAKGLYDSNRTRLMTALANTFDDDSKFMIENQLYELENEHQAFMKQIQGMGTPGGGPPPLPGAGAPANPYR